MHRRETGARHDVGDVGAQIGIDDLRAGDAHDRVHLLLRQVADLEDAGLLGLDQEHGLVLDLGRDRGCHADLVDAVGSLSGFDRQLDVDGRLLLLQQDGGGIGLLQGRFLEVDALDLEHGVLLVGHG